MAQRSAKKITQHEEFELWEDGVKYGKNIHRVYTVGSENNYVKFYIRGLLYIRDMPPDCLQLLLLLLPYLRYAEPSGSHMFDYSLTITVNKPMREYLKQQMGYKDVRSISNLLTELTDGGVLMHAAKGVYRVNPHLLGKGEAKDMGEARHHVRAPAEDDTFMSVYNFTQKLKKAKKEGKDINQIRNDDPDDLGPIDATY